MSHENKPVVVISAAARAVNEVVKATKAFSAAQGQFEIIQNELPALVEQIEIKQGELFAVNEETAIAVRKQKVELTLRVAENEDEVLNSLLESRGLSYITSEDVGALKQELRVATHEVESRIGKAVESALKNERSTVALKAAEDGAAIKVEAATSKARIESLEEQLAAAQVVAGDLRNQLDAEREAGTERARAAGSMTINTATQK